MLTRLALTRIARKVIPAQKIAFRCAIRSFSSESSSKISSGFAARGSSNDDKDDNSEGDAGEDAEEGDAGDEETYGGLAEEPEFLVAEEEYLEDTSIVKIPYIREEDRIDLYLKFLSDPKKWGVNKLAAIHGAHPDRIKAILTLMEGRFNKFKEFGFEISPSGQPVIPPAWQRLHDLRKENPSMPLSDLSAAAGLEGTKDEELNKILATMADYTWRHENHLDHMETMKEKLAEYDEVGVDTDFQEDMDEGGRFTDTYFPALLGDEEYEAEKKKLLRRIQNETKAVKIRDFEYYIRKHSEVPSKVVNSEGIEELSATESEALKVEDIVAPKHDHSAVKNFSRFKYAFRDLSFQNYKGLRGALSEELPEVAAATAEKDKDGNVKPIAPDTRRRKNVASFAAPPATMMLSRGGM